MKSIVTFLVASIVLTALVLIPDTNGTASSARKAAPVPSEMIVAPQPPAVIDGAINPELIPDRVAYSLMFRLIANRKTPEEKSRIRAYIRQIGLSDVDIDGLIAAAEEFQQRVGKLDMQAKQIKASNRGTPTDQFKAYLVRLQNQKDAIVDHIIVSLPHRLRGDGLGRVRQHVNERVKQRVRIRPN